KLYMDLSPWSKTVGILKQRVFQAIPRSPDAKEHAFFPGHHRIIREINAFDQAYLGFRFRPDCTKPAYPAHFRRFNRC
ncbi:MAG TPA: hypothetical protein VN114_10385, partial [Oxalicibacterium sp.]|uniref:hypothetical protein n=1 Tax=Oxalicibacterium sp. TaxID=2766525 RepID=UPI002BE5A4E2